MIKILTLLAVFITHSNALVLEELPKTHPLYTSKKMGFYVGSFDPLHLGHERLAKQLIEEGHCDYVLIYPAWGGDNYKKRSDIKIRHDMVFSAFADHPHVVVTRMPPQDLQHQLKGPEFIGIVGSDTALSLNENPKAASAFITGMPINEKYYNHTVGGLMALRADSFIVSVRAGDDITPLSNKIGGRPIIAIIKSEKEHGLSSTAVKKTLKEGQPIDQMVSPGVEKIIYLAKNSTELQ